MMRSPWRCVSSTSAATTASESNGTLETEGISVVESHLGPASTLARTSSRTTCRACSSLSSSRVEALGDRRNCFGRLWSPGDRPAKKASGP